MNWEYVIVHDGDPRMDGTHQRVQIGRFDAFKTANRECQDWATYRGVEGQA